VEPLLRFVDFHGLENAEEEATELLEPQVGMHIDDLGDLDAPVANVHVNGDDLNDQAELVVPEDEGPARLVRDAFESCGSVSKPAAQFPGRTAWLMRG